ncbi:hypothetical protein D3C74_334030 [compost metagenome]
MGQLGQIADAADLFEFAAVLQLRGQRDEVDRLAFLAQLNHRFKDQLMRLIVKILGPHPLHRGDERFRLQQYRPEYRLFSF